MAGHGEPKRPSCIQPRTASLKAAYLSFVRVSALSYTIKMVIAAMRLLMKGRRGMSLDALTRVLIDKDMLRFAGFLGTASGEPSCGPDCTECSRLVVLPHRLVQHLKMGILKHSKRLHCPEQQLLDRNSLERQMDHAPGRGPRRCRHRNRWLPCCSVAPDRLDSLHCGQSGRIRS